MWPLLHWNLNRFLVSNGTPIYNTVNIGNGTKNTMVNSTQCNPKVGNSIVCSNVNFTFKNGHRFKLITLVKKYASCNTKIKTNYDYKPKNKHRTNFIIIFTAVFLWNAVIWTVSMFEFLDLQFQWLHRLYVGWLWNKQVITVLPMN